MSFGLAAANCVCLSGARGTSSAGGWSGGSPSSFPGGEPRSWRQTNASGARRSTRRFGLPFCGSARKGPAVIPRIVIQLLALRSPPIASMVWCPEHKKLAVHLQAQPVGTSGRMGVDEERSISSTLLKTLVSTGNLLAASMGRTRKCMFIIP